MSDGDVLAMVLEEMRSMRESLTKFQDEVRKEFKEIRKELSDHQRNVDKLEGKIAIIAAAAAAVMTGVGQWVATHFFK